jgi:hypothetical protein
LHVHGFCKVGKTEDSTQLTYLSEGPAPHETSLRVCLTMGAHSQAANGHHGAFGRRLNKHMPKVHMGVNTEEGSPKIHIGESCCAQSVGIDSTSAREKRSISRNRHGYRYFCKSDEESVERESSPRDRIRLVEELDGKTLCLRCRRI